MPTPPHICDKPDVVLNKSKVGSVGWLVPACLFDLIVNAALSQGVISQNLFHIHSDEVFSVYLAVSRLLGKKRAEPWLPDTAGEQELLCQPAADVLEPHVRKWWRW